MSTTFPTPRLAIVAGGKTCLSVPATPAVFLTMAPSAGQAAALAVQTWGWFCSWLCLLVVTGVAWRTRGYNHGSHRWTAGQVLEWRWQCMDVLVREVRVIRLSRGKLRGNALWNPYKVLTRFVAHELLDLFIIAQHVLNSAWQLISFTSLQQKNKEVDISNLPQEIQLSKRHSSGS